MNMWGSLNVELVMIRALFVAALSAGSAAAQPVTAADLNEQGKELLANADYAGASQRFREAVALEPNPKYYFNLCLSLSQEGLVTEARNACAEVRARSNDAALLEKTRSIENALDKPTQGAGTPAGSGPSTVGVAPTAVALPNQAEAKPYMFGLGADVLRLNSTGGTMLRARADWHLLSQLGIGAQFWLDLAEKRANAGVGAYKHFGQGTIVITPLVGYFSAATDQVDFGKLNGFRFDLSAALRFGTNRRHEVSASAAIYTTYDSTTDDDIQADSAIGVGYTYRFGAAQQIIALTPY